MMAATLPAVLIVDDDLSIRELVAEVLRLEGYEVVEAGDVPGAIEAIGRHTPPAGRLSLVLLDMRLNGAAGDEVLGYMQGLAAAPRVVLMTASSEHLAAATAAGHDTIPKPFDLDDLLAVVARGAAVRE